MMTISLATLAVATIAQAAPEVIVSVADQKLYVIDGPKKIATYKISTSKFGVGDGFRSYRTPTGTFRVAGKVGGNLVPGAVLKGLRPTGEVLAPNAPGRDPIVTRVLTLAGQEAQNAHARSRGIYIHGTPEEKRIGKPASYGCIRMRSKDVMELYEAIPVGALVRIQADRGARIAASGAAASPAAGGARAQWFQ